MDIITILKLVGVALAAIFVVFCIFKALKQGFFSFLGCLCICAIGFILAVFLINKPLFFEYYDKFMAWLLPLFK